VSVFGSGVQAVAGLTLAAVHLKRSGGRFEDGSTVQVVLTPAGDRRFTLTEYAGPANQ